MARKPKQTDPNSGVFRIPGTARFLDCSDRQAYRLIQSGQLKSFKINGMRVVRRKTLEEFIAARESESQAS
jgi:hypothetical protein